MIRCGCACRTLAARSGVEDAISPRKAILDYERVTICRARPTAYGTCDRHQPSTVMFRLRISGCQISLSLCQRRVKLAGSLGRTPSPSSA